MGCKPSRGEQGKYKGESSTTAKDEPAGLSLLEVPADDYVSSICGFGNSHFAVAGAEGWLYLYDSQALCLASKTHAHKKAVNKVLAGPGGSIFTGSTDATARLWRHENVNEGASLVQTFEGHQMSVSTVDVVDDWSVAGQTTTSTGGALLTGSRDCSLRLWDVESGRTLQQNKILRNVVTAVRRVPNGPAGASTLVQASEDLQLRLWDLRAGLGKGPAMAVRAGPNLMLCLDVAEDGSWVACGSKGFSRENCEVKLFDLRGGLRELAALPTADQTLEALRCVGPDRCLTASKDGYLRALAVPEPELLSEHRGAGTDAYTALGVIGGEAPRAMAAWTGPGGVGLEILAWPDSLASPPTLLAST
mmetsp:Transcript_12656/g.22381  ORF Transcript_12656/g.22381 Transcript_12656/m.22381 type:complete len:362 (+) Transcript_12656:41-1126(+)|eukprot:CAMPEP_0197658520 /NCGR_PEP_ID=MMETSP1338-20131121/45288_1 /TAXON_ID=43686 ORGANISM="Pelagodinium beii, Strain RCC1491" /NCGR_SAMPLE_ID=MMETSP1338 /ASSEMBLY_ACC=CAM_ASM_000754 /LENGTH=361 /DNA_ID=CAMNT_0043235125 /DNA_START=39 /DNA_END=1124 /DNA_ORIENTATION=-